MWALWQSDSEGRQLALLVPGWLHGCLGVNFAFGRRAWYQRARPLFFAVALLLPVLGALGFLAMGKELAADVANRAFLDSNSDVDAATRIALARTRDTLLALWFALIGSVFVAREVRAFVERRRNTAIAIAYPQRVARVPAGWSVLEASRSHHIPHMSMCGGNARCSTCRVQVTAGDAHCPPPEAPERATLDRIGAAPGVRLACQLRPTGDVAVVPLLAATGACAGARTGLPPWPSTISSSFSSRGAIATCSRAGTCRRTSSTCRGCSSRRWQAPSSRPGGTVSETRVDGVIALFGLAGEAAAARGHARTAAIAIDRALAGLRRRYASEFGAPADFTTFVHEGPGAVSGDPSGQAGHLLAAGEAFDTIAALSTADLGRHAAIVVTARATEGLALDAEGAAWRKVAPADGAPPMRVAVFADADALQRGTAPG